MAEAAFAIDDDRRLSARAWKNLQERLKTFDLFEACCITFGPDRGKLVFDAIQMFKANKRGGRKRK